MEQGKFNELMQATDVLYHMIWRNPSGGVHQRRERVCLHEQN